MQSKNPMKGMKLTEIENAKLLRVNVSHFSGSGKILRLIERVVGDSICKLTQSGGGEAGLDW